MSGRQIAMSLKINRRTVARILAGPEAQRLVTEARERARHMVEKADEALYKSLARGSSRVAIAVLRGAGVFETRCEAIVRRRFQDQRRAQNALEEHLRQSRRETEDKFGRRLNPDTSAQEWEREQERLDRLTMIRQEAKANPPLEEDSYMPAQALRPFRRRGRFH
jgi:DNA-binding transcriptional regulator YhcF (GntR family)